MIEDRYFFAVLASIVLLVSVFSAGMAYSAERAEDVEMNMTVLMQKKSVDTEVLEMYPDYRVVEEYDSYLLVETSVEDVQSLEERGYIAEELKNRDYVGLQSHSFNTGEGEPELPEELEIDEYSDDETGYYIVQFIGPIKAEWQKKIEEEGGEIHEFRHRFNQIIEMDQETRRDVEELKFVDWTGIYHPAYRFDRELLERTEPLYLDVIFFEGAEIGPIVNGMADIDAELDHIGEDRVSLEAEPDEIVSLANLPDVKSITEGNDEYRVFNSRATWVTQTNLQEFRKVTEKGVTSQGELITVMDSGLNETHEAFADDQNPIGDNHRKIQARYVPTGGEGDVESGRMHGTHVTGTVLGESEPYGEYSNQDGHSLEARVIFQDVSTDGQSLGVPDDMYNNGYGDAYNRGSRVHTNSWGGRGAGEYTEFSQETDEFLWDHKDFNVLFAAGNDGDDENTVSPQGSTKNVITVGAMEGGAGGDDGIRGGNDGNDLLQDDQDNVASFSSRGYTADGRIKPDITQIGDGVMSADNGDATGYTDQSGTSMACPGMAGQVGQVRDYYNSGWYPTGTPTDGDAWEPSNALVRATLINGAVEATGSGAYLNDNRFPNNDQGFGRSKLDRSLYFEGDSRDVKVFDSLEEGVKLNTGESWDMEFVVKDPNQELEVTLAWTDAPGPAGADESNPAIVNDLDLEVEGPFDTRYVGNAYTGTNPGYSKPDPESNYWSGLREGNEYDGLNVIENVLLAPGHNGVEEGKYKVTVNAHQVGGSYQGQPFAIVISGGDVGDVAPGDPPQIDLNYPVGGEEFDARDQVEIQWDTTAGDDPINYINLDYSIDNGDSWKKIEDDLDDTGTYQWTVPNWDSEECKVRATAVDQEFRTSFDSSDTFTIHGIPPQARNWLEVERHTLDGEMVENKDFVGDYEPWQLTILQEQGQARWDRDNYSTGGSIYTQAYQAGDGTSTEEAYWEQELPPIASEMEVSGAFKKNIEEEEGDFGSGSVNQATAEIQVNDSETGWETVLAAEGTYDMSWTEFSGDGTYQPTGYVNSVRARMHVEAQGADGFIQQFAALGEIWMDNISVYVNYGIQDAHNILNWEASDSPTEEVSHYNIYRAEDSTGPWDEPLTQIESDGSPEYTHIDPVKGAEDDVLWWYVVRAVGRNGLEEDNTWAVREPIPGEPPAITVTSPNGGEFWLSGSEKEITWTTTQGDDPVDDIALWYSADSGSNWTKIERGLPDTGLYNWTVPAEVSDTCLVRARAWDSAARVSEFDKSDEYFEIVDPDEVDLPAVNVISPTDTYVDESDVVVDWESENATYHEIRLDQNNWIDTGSDTQHVFEGVEDGQHSVEVKAVGEKDITDTDEVVFTVDATRPNIEIVSPEEGHLSPTDNVTVEWTGEDETSGIDFYETSIDGGDWIDEGTDILHPYEGLEDGEHSVEVRANDRAGNTESKSITFTIDTSPPVVDITSPEDNAWISESSVTVRWEKEDEASPAQHQEIWLDGELEGEDDEGDWIQYDINNLEEGNHTVRVQATDGEGRESDDEVTFSIDTIAPGLEIVSPDNEEFLNEPNVTVSWEAEPQGSGIQQREVRLDENEWIEADSETSHTFEGLSDADYLVEVKVVDEAGNEAIEDVIFSIDTATPTVDITSPNSGEPFDEDEVTVYWDPEPDGTEIQRYQVRLNEGEWQEADTETSHSFMGLPEGEQTIGVRVTDEAGNYAVDDISVIIDTTPPGINITSPEFDVELDDKTVTVEWEGEPKGTDIVDYEIRINDGEWIKPDSNNFHTFEDLEDGSYTVDIRAEDEAGNVNHKTVNFKVNTPPFGSYLRLTMVLIPVIALILLVILGLIWKRRKDEEEEESAEVLGGSAAMEGEVSSEQPLQKRETTGEGAETSTITGTDREAWEEPEEETMRDEEQQEPQERKKQECPICGAEVAGDVVECPECGEPLGEEEIAETPPEPEDLERMGPREMEETEEEVPPETPSEPEDLEKMGPGETEETEEEVFEEETKGTEESGEAEEVEEAEEGAGETGVIECPVCGREISPDAEKCWACGEEITGEESE
ncbi:MAG: S8 family serine peptidase [Candidatus Thermoplasmatota archaeon]